MDDSVLIQEQAGPSRADAVQNRILLLSTAQRLFAAQGVESVSMAEVARSAGVGKGTLYRHFRNKSELCLALLDQDQRSLQDRTLARLRAVHDPLENLRWFMGEVVAFVERNDTILAEASAAGFSSLEMAAHLWWRQTILGLLRQTRPAPSFDVEYMADLLYIMLDVRTLHFQRYTVGYPTQRILNGLNTLLSRLIL